MATGGADHAFGAIDLGRPVADEQRDAVLFVPFGSRQGELRGTAVFKILREVDAIVSGAWLFAKSDDSIMLLGIELDEALTEPKPNHAVPDDDNGFLSRESHDLPPNEIANVPPLPEANSIPASGYRGPSCAKPLPSLEIIERESVRHATISWSARPELVRWLLNS